MKKAILFLIPLAVIGLLFTYYRGGVFDNKKAGKVACTLEAKICPDGTAVGRIPPDCEFEACPRVGDIIITSPTDDQIVSSPLRIEGRARGSWFFEGQFNAELYDGEGRKIGSAILTAKGEWMTNDLVPFEGTLSFQKPTTSEGTLKFLSANPSGLPENQSATSIPVKLNKLEENNVLLYYYNQEKDRNPDGNTDCTSKGLVAVIRSLPPSKTPIRDTINLFLKGSENLQQEDTARGIGTEYPLEGVKLKDLNLKSDGTLIIVLDDPLSKTSGGSCRIGILSMQLTETVKQFPEVKRVQYQPENIFQP